MKKSKGAEPAIVVEGLEILSYIELRCATAGWWTDPSALSTVVAAITATARWKELDVVGVAFRRGAPIGSSADVAKLLSSGPGVYTFARGEPRHATHGDESDAWLQFGVAQRGINIISHVRGEVLERLGPAAIDDMLEAVSKIRSSLDGFWVREMHTRPTATDDLSYPHLVAGPLPDSATPLAAVLDVVERDPSDDATDAVSQNARLIAKAKVPAEATRQTLGKLVAIRWIVDPRSPVEVCQAAARHEAWLVKLLRGAKA